MPEFPSRYDFALSFAGTDRTIAESLFNTLSEHEIEVFYDKNEQHRIVANDIEEYLAPIYASDAIFVVCILGPDYPTRIWTRFESAQFKQRFKPGEVIPIVLDSVTLGVFDLAEKVGFISWNTNVCVKDEANRVSEILRKKLAEARTERG